MMVVPRITLNKACEFILDGTHGSPERTDMGIPVLSAQNVIHGEFNLSTNRYTSVAEYNAFKKRLDIDQGDVLLTIVGTIGRAAVVREKQPMVLQRSIAILRPKRETIDSRFLYYALGFPESRRQLDRLTNKSAQAGVYLGKLKTIEIPLPPLHEQKRIAAILDKADSIRRKRQEAVRMTEELLRSVFLDMFGDPVMNPKGWKEVTVRDLVSEVKYGTSDKASYEGKYPVLRMNNITYLGNWNFTDLKRIDIPDKELSKYLVRKGDILFNRTNSKELVGKTAVYRRDEPMVYAGYLIRIRPNKHNSSEYIAAYLNSTFGKTILESMCKSIVGMANINAQELQEIAIMQPPLDLQNQYSSFAHYVEKAKEKLITSAEVSDTLFNALLQHAFKGDM
jgi:type I restriction enzyme, S subunit